MRLSDLIPVNTVFFIWDAIVAWRDYIFKTDFYKCSKGSYFTNMLKLIESKIVDVRLQLKHVNEAWLNECKKKIDSKSDWAKSTKTVRKSCLNTFYNFITHTFDKSQIPYQRHPSENEIEYMLSSNIDEEEKYEAFEKAALKHVLSNVSDKVRTRDISPDKLCKAVSKINERDAYIVWLMMHTGQPLEKILDLRKEDLDAEYMSLEESMKHTPIIDPSNPIILAYSGYVRFANDSKYIPGNIVDEIDKFRKNSKVYLFETATGKRVTRTQVTRNLKLAGKNIGLDFELTPKILRGYVCAYMSKDKRSELEKGLGILTN